jgi:hypothetical protein
MSTYSDRKDARLIKERGCVHENRIYQEVLCGYGYVHRDTDMYIYPFPFHFNNAIGIHICTCAAKPKTKCYHSTSTKYNIPHPNQH